MSEGSFSSNTEQHDKPLMLLVQLVMFQQSSHEHMPWNNLAQ